MNDENPTQNADDGEPNVEVTEKTDGERVDALLPGDLDSEVIPEDQKTLRPVVVGLGASAGGLEALSAFFEVMPPDTGMAFVVVTHLSPDHKSLMDELLQRHTSMPVIQVSEEALPIHPNHVYVTPPNRQLVMSDTHLNTGAFEEPRGGRSPIDIFFRSLAAVHAESVAVILTGGGSDGALGARSVKEAGGLLMVQDPREAAYDSMPQAAIATGLADVVLPVRDLAAKLVEISRRRIYVPTDPLHLSSEQHDLLQRILTLLQARTNHDFRHYKQSTVLRRIQRRMQLNGYETLDGYLHYLRQNANEAPALFSDLLIGVTNFFRDAESWRRLEEGVIPRLFDGKGGGATIRVWSVGCSTGEEAYSLAILLLEHAARLDERPKLQVFATDLEDVALARAREGLYPEAISADVSPERLQRYFTQEGAYYRVRREVRDLVLFAAHSALRDPPFSRLDLIVCRNLLIYLQRPLQDNLFEIFYYALRPDGFLFLGSSETADSAADLFQTIDKRHRLYQAREWTGQAHTLPHLPLMSSRADTQRPAPVKESSPLLTPSGAPGVLQRAFEEDGPPTILIDDESNIVHLTGAAGRYLRHPDGPPTSNLIRLVRSELQIELRSALFQAFNQGLSVVTSPVIINTDGQDQRVYVAVWPRRAPGEQPFALVLFMEDQRFAAMPKTEETEPADRSASAAQQLADEVRYLRERLQATVEAYETSNEELKAANEELQSINEEYRSTTEELETSKEELQSVNEELETLNNELKTKIEEVSRANSDLQNLMTSTEITTLFLDRELRVKRYTPSAERLFNIMPADRGRLIDHLTHRLEYPTLSEDAHQVLRSLASIRRELRSVDGAWYQAQLRPYRTIDDRIEGVVLTFVDVSQLKAANQEAAELRDSLHLALTSADMGWGVIHLATGELEQDERARAICGFGPDEPLTLDTFLALVHPDDLARVRAAFETDLGEGRVQDTEYRLIRRDGEIRAVHATGSIRRGVNGDAPLITGTLLDVTDRRRDEKALNRLNTSLEQQVRERTEDLEESAGRLSAARDRFRTFFESNPAPSVIFSPSRRVFVDANPAALAFIGVAREQLVGQPAGGQAIEAILAQAAQEGRIQALEYEYDTPEGRGAVLLSVEPIEVEGEACLLGTFIDITAQKEAERQVRELASQLSLSEQAERQRIAAVLHDNLQQALYAAQIQLAGLQGEVSQGNASAATAQFGRIQELLRTCIDIARHVSVDLSPPILRGEGLVDTLNWLARQMRDQYGLEVAVRLIGEWRRLEEGVRLLLFQMVRELLFNVVKHANTSTVTVKLQQQSDLLTIDVRDDGDGFDVERLFTRPSGPTGTGLILLRQRLSLYNGDLEIQSRTGAGTNVRIVLPLTHVLEKPKE
ncbi:chemotaxis protein CheB [Promineifilum sp.]|uniref:chemotaxis protein CheB n=1 Tax=Promineifilum sp. TaxID=2664178 RepID=UPI0035B46135